MIQVLPLPAYLVKRYHGWKATTHAENKAWYRRLAADGQHPRAMVISCCDSRVHVTSIFGADQGEFFIHRNIANLVPPFETKGDYHGTSAALEFAVTRLKVKQIVVLGHANCGGIRALMENDASTRSEGFIDSWMQIAAPAKKEVLSRSDLDTPELRTDACEKTAVSYSLRNLMTHPWICSRVEAGSLGLVGYYYDLRSGELVNVDEIKASTLLASKDSNHRHS